MTAVVVVWGIFLRLLIGRSSSYLVPDWLGCVRPFVVLHCGCVPPNVSVRSFGDIVGASPPILCLRPFVAEHCGCVPPFISVELLNDF